jgi:hypothetical protein
VRGTGRAELQVRAGNWEVGRWGIELKRDQWQRLVVTFDPRVASPRGHSLGFTGTGELQIDAAQVEIGTKPTAYRMAGAMEIALATNANEGVRFAGEPLQLKYELAGDLTGATLKLLAVDIAGRSRELASVPRVARSGTLDVPALPLGSYRIEAIATRNGAELASAEQVVHVLQKPVMWGQDAPASPFGIHCAANRRQMFLAKAIGANWVRLHDASDSLTAWYFLEKKPGEWTFNDEGVKRFRDQKLMMLGMLSTAPYWETHFDKERNSYWDKFYQPKDLNRYGDYVERIATRYKGQIDHWDVWNEPWNDSWWAVAFDESKKPPAGYVRSKTAATDFAKLQAVAFARLKKVNPGATLVGINSTDGEAGSGSIAGVDWTRGVIAAGGLETCDVASYHQYTSGPNLFPGDAAERGFKLAMGEVGNRRPIWFTEGQPLLGMMGDGLYKRTVATRTTEYALDTSDRLVRYVVSLLAQGTNKTFLYTMHGYANLDNPGEWNVLVTGDGKLHPSAAAYSAMAQLLEGKTFAGRTDIAADLFVYRFDNATESVAVVARGPNFKGKLRIAGNAKALDLQGNPFDDSLGNTVMYLTAPRDAMAGVIGSLQHP